MGFQYSLEGVLEYRKKVEESKKEKFIHANNQYIDENTQLENIQITYRETISVLKEKDNMSLMDQKNYMQYMLNLQQKIEKQKIRVNDFKKQCDLARVELTKAQKERKIMETLEEKELHRFNMEMKRKEQNELSEIATVSYVRQRRESQR